ncbi:23S rRNA (guanosine(2251)-2'-O)-methyltransferase RlmB [Prolixibacter denitrificans]|uniref:23S rRNA (Guanosine(2251)-2'-O)-methyltransferase RlmB n=1 Tax=Prolixibacter denitrificans TaxID=1541063 RepID=A0A2P8CD43_9BACT|nr:23S rRNA (guanosine(2251)-2'-O)-methyltransferase RlmB [Prolixibacter denitrificans]PSK82880.1 23S rRNA (guanosine2251-2'-O)-methyltransferase [Prolixibacter denitrificans]GET21304.1 23S rRNA (guanosine(2251)-2'-O)-methyltransferase RlmB [Prolixibacter denitrificans]
MERKKNVVRHHRAPIDKSTYVFGTRAVIEAIKSGKEIEKILVRKGLSNELSRELFSLVREMDIPVQNVPIERIDRITRKNHQGVLAFLSPITYQKIENIIPGIYEKGEVPLILVLDKISDVRNFGAIARSAEVAGAHAIVVPEKGAAQVNADALKTSAGALNMIPVCRVKSLREAIVFLQESGLHILAATEKGDKNYFETSMQEPTAIVMGAEDKGIEPELLKFADEWVKIPQFGQIASLNVSVAASVLIFEAVRQRMQASS